MRRRQFITLVGGAAAAWPLTARGQQGERVRRVGIVMPYVRGDSEFEARARAFRDELARLGWSNVQFDERWTTDNVDRVRAEAANLLASNPDVVIALGGRVIPVLLELSRSVPIVIPGVSDPVGVGWAESLARPGGNITGFTFLELSMFGKLLETLKQLAPAIARVGFIYNPDNPNTAIFSRQLRDAATTLGLQAVDAPVHGLADIERAIATLAGGAHSGVLFPPDLTISALRERVVRLVAEHQLPAVYSDPVFVKIGGLAFYGADRTDLFRRAAGYVGRILRGDKPGELPFQQPTKFQLVINLKTAKALGLEVPPMLLARADEVIE
jgi:putative ABC transport system substrate-binding protein